MCKKCLTLILSLSMLLCLVACGDSGTKNHCVKCGSTATTTLSGSADIMEKNGISLSSCNQISSTIYSAYLCDSCCGPVHHVTPDP